MACFSRWLASLGIRVRSISGFCRCWVSSLVRSLRSFFGLLTGAAVRFFGCLVGLLGALSQVFVSAAECASGLLCGLRSFVALHGALRCVVVAALRVLRGLLGALGVLHWVNAVVSGLLFAVC